MVCLAVCKSQPIIRISASFDPSAVWVDTAQSTRAVARPTSLWHHYGGAIGIVEGQRSMSDRFFTIKRSRMQDRRPVHDHGHWCGRGADRLNEEKALAVGGYVVLILSD